MRRWRRRQAQRTWDRDANRSPWRRREPARPGKRASAIHGKPQYLRDLAVRHVPHGITALWRESRSCSCVSSLRLACTLADMPQRDTLLRSVLGRLPRLILIQQPQQQRDRTPPHPPARPHLQIQRHYSRNSHQRVRNHPPLGLLAPPPFLPGQRAPLLNKARRYKRTQH